MDMKTIFHNGITLHLVKSPTADDIGFFKSDLALHPLIVSELSQKTLHPKMGYFGETGMLVMQFPHFDRHSKTVITSEVDFIIESNRLTLVQYEDLEPLDTLMSDLANGKSALRGELFQKSGPYLLYKIINHLMDGLFPQLDHIIKKVDKLEARIFAGEEEKMVKEITLLRREAIDFSRIIKPNKDILHELIGHLATHFDSDLALYFHDIDSTNNRIVKLIDNQIETLHILNETNQSLLSNKTNSIIRVLTIFSVIIFPLTLFATLWAMDVPTPLSGNQDGFWIIVISMITGAAVMLLIFKSKKWI